MIFGYFDVMLPVPCTLSKIQGFTLIVCTTFNFCIQELSVDKIKLDGVNMLAQKLISQDHSGSTTIQQSLYKLNQR